MEHKLRKRMQVDRVAAFADGTGSPDGRTTARTRGSNVYPENANSPRVRTEPEIKILDEDD